MATKTLDQGCKIAAGPFACSGADSPEADLLAYYLSLVPSKRDELFLDTATAAERIGVSQRTIQAWIDAGFIRAVPVGRKFRVHVESLLNYVRTRALRRAT